LSKSTKLPAHVSSDEAIAQMEDKIKQKQIAEEKNHKEEREMKWLKNRRRKKKKPRNQ